MFVFNTLEVDGKAYSADDAESIIPAKKYGLEDGFYGGRVKYIGKTDSDILLLMFDPNTVIDTGAEDLDNIPIEMVRKLCDMRKIKHHPRHGKDKLIKLLRGEAIEKDDEG